MSEIDTVWHNDTVLLHEYDTTSSMHHVKIPIYDPQHFLVNGLGQSQLIDSVIVTGQVDENIYVRLANIGYYKNIVVLPSGLNARIVSSDGRPLSTEIETDSVVVYPGEYYAKHRRSLNLKLAWCTQISTQVYRLQLKWWRLTFRDFLESTIRNINLRLESPQTQQTTL